MKTSINRRQFLFNGGACGVAIVGVQAMFGSAVLAAELEPLELSNPTAMALGYVVDAESVDKEKFKRYESGQTCANCQLYLGAPDGESGGCPLFAGKSVRARGWCISWIQKAA